MDSYILTLDSQLLYSVIIQLISTGILCTILSTLLYKPVTNFLQKRRERIENNINEANNKLAEADSLKAEYEIKLKDIEKEKATILEEARARGKQNEAQIIEEAKKEAEAIKNRAMLDIEREQEKAKEEIRLQIIEVSSLVASKFISEKISEAEQNKLVEQVIADLGEVKWQN
ncbi:F0F1 ATP synthase subunit B [[Clostridium] colinum]|uniref:F0F1 ATP synthase subunit B n=1 Tax=[Clostridium] colinum TaxID=36835 RepID=UPI002023D507|nr:F0F1 ATP synthase subunit B [[Clostridium] colinum]